MLSLLWSNALLRGEDVLKDAHNECDCDCCAGVRAPCLLHARKGSFVTLRRCRSYGGI